MTLRGGVPSFPREKHLSGIPRLAGRSSVRPSDRLRLEKHSYLVFQDRAAPDISLYEVALVLRKDIELSSVIDTFGDDLDLHLVHQTDDRADHEALGILDRELIDERLIDLQYIDRELLEIVQ